MKKVYAVNSGTYSDYKVDAIFSTREKAKEYMEIISNDYNEIETYEIDPDIVDKIKQGYFVWNVAILKDGTIETVSRTENESYEISNIGVRIWERTKAPAYRGTDIKDMLLVTTLAKTEKQAIKIANEHRARMIANNEF